MTIRIGTRSSQLALWQANHVAQLLQQAGMQTDLVLMETIGDKILDRTLSKIGSKGVFTEELETALRENHIDIAVHSAKDMPSELPDDLELIAFGERENVHDVLVSSNPNLHISQPLTLGTSSTRRVALLRHYYPHIKTVDMRGNLQTRMRKLAEGQCDALVLAYAGVFRMDYTDKIVLQLPLHTFTPAVGQGSIAIEAAKSISPTLRNLIRQAVNHEETAYQLEAERSFLHALQGGCSIPSFALATYQDKTITLQGGLVSLDGQRLLRASATGTVMDTQSIGQKVAEQILAQGGDDILRSIRQELK